MNGAQRSRDDTRCVLSVVQALRRASAAHLIKLLPSAYTHTSGLSTHTQKLKLLIIIAKQVIALRQYCELMRSCKAFAGNLIGRM